jgi:hypothetical protein
MIQSVLWDLRVSPSVNVILRHDTVQFGTNVWRNLFCSNPVNPRSPDATICTTHPRLQVSSVAFDIVLTHSLEKVHVQKLTIRLKLVSLMWHGLSDISFCSVPVWYKPHSTWGSNITSFILSPQCFMYKYWYFMSTKISTTPTTFSGKQFYIIVTSITSDVFFQTHLKKFLTMQKGLLTNIPFLYIHT